LASLRATGSSSAETPGSRRLIGWMVAHVFWYPHLSQPRLNASSQLCAFAQDQFSKVLELSDAEFSKGIGERALEQMIELVDPHQVLHDGLAHCRLVDVWVK